MKINNLIEAKSFGFIGGGRITRIILTGLSRAGQMPANVVVSDSEEQILSRLKESFPDIRVTLNGNATAAAQDIVFLALHPPAIAGLLDEIGRALEHGSILVSLAPKLRLAQLSSGLGGFDRLVRMIPNAPSIINEGYNPVAFASGVASEEKRALLDMFKLLGQAPEVAEEKLESYAILTAMGPTYFWPQLDELRSLGESFGLSNREVTSAIPAMLAGAVSTMFSANLSAEEIMNLIPVKPLADDEPVIREIYRTKLTALYERLKG
jgi:pyrroline-5-carboxylate reductase